MSREPLAVDDQRHVREGLVHQQVSNRLGETVHLVNLGLAALGRAGPAAGRVAEPGGPVRARRGPVAHGSASSNVLPRTLPSKAG